MSGQSYDKVRMWVQQYASGGAEDPRAVSDFITCETDELVKVLRAQLSAIAQGNYDEENLDQIVGIKRKVRHGSYDAWAKLMLLWLIEAKKH